MSFLCKQLLLGGAMILVCVNAGCHPGRASADDERAVLRVCADPNNLPFSNREELGFENRLAELVADELDREVSYTWWPQRRGFIRNTLRAEKCDVVMGIPTTFELAQPTDPYYRSTYVFLTRRDRDLDIESLDDPRLRDLRIGLHVIGDDYSNVPAAQAFAKRGIIDNVRGYTIYGDYSKPNPPARLVEAVANDEVDVAVVWGPLAGYFAQRSDVALEMVPVTPQIDLPFVPFVFDISMGVRRSDSTFRAQLDTVLRDRRGDIQELLASYGVPTVSGKKKTRIRRSGP